MSLLELSTLQWTVFVFAAILIGIAKTGIAGLGLFAAVLVANLLPARLASGFVLPMLIFADLFAVMLYRRHAEWSHLWRLCPWTALGVVLGYFTMGRIDDRQASVVIGLIVIGLVSVHVWRKWRPAPAEKVYPVWFAPGIGMLAGFTTLLANAAGPLMAIYLLAMRLPKMAFVGTAAVFFMIMNWFKVPFMINLKLITVDSFGTNLVLLPAVAAGALMGRWIIKRLNPLAFEIIVLVSSAIAGLRLLLH